MNESVKLDSDQLADVVSAVTDGIMQQLEKKDADAAVLAAETLATEESEAAEKLAAKEGKEKAAKGEAPTAVEVAAEVAKLLGGQTKENTDKLYKTMFGEKLTASEAAIPGFSEFLNGNDDYGDVRREQLLGVDDYSKRVTALATLSNAYKQASAGGDGGRTPVVSKAIQKKVAENETRYKEANDKFDEGGYDNLAAYTSDMMAIIAEEVESLTN